MKIILTTTITFLLFLSPLIGYSQVGINTNTPLGVFHVDPKKNSASNNSDLLKDDVIIDNEGKLGLGNSQPISRVDLRTNENNERIIAIGNTNQSASIAGKGAIKYTNSTLQYSNGTNWINLATAPQIKTVVAGTKDTWGSNANNLYCYSGGFDTNQSSIPNRAPCYIRLWSIKYINSENGGTFNAETGQFTAKRNGVFTASFTFTLSSNKIEASSGNANQVEAIWRHLRNGTEINSVKCANTYSSNSTSNVKIGSSCTANFDMQPNDVIRPELWIDVSSGSGNNQDNNQRRVFDISNNGAYNNLTIVEN